MVKKNITIDDLAVMIQNGFDNTATKEQLENLENKVEKIDKRLVNVEKDVKEIKFDLRDISSRTDKLETDVRYIENTLNIPQTKK